MEKLLPKWLMKRYLILLEGVGTEPFDFGSAETKLARIGDDKRMVGLFLSDLRRTGWLEVELDKNDARRRIYKLRAYETIFNNYVKNLKSEIKRGK